MPNPAHRILIVAGLCIALLVGMVVREGVARVDGVEVKMAMQGVDPRTLLSGNYVTVSLRDVAPISNQCGDLVGNGAKQWVALQPGVGLTHFAGVAATREGAQKLSPLVVRGTVMCDSQRIGDAGVANSATLNLGVEHFYVSQAQADRINDLLRHADRDAPSPVNAILSIGRDGRARLKGLEVKGERLELNWL